MIRKVFVSRNGLIAFCIIFPLLALYVVAVFSPQTPHTPSRFVARSLGLPLNQQTNPLRWQQLGPANIPEIDKSTSPFAPQVDTPVAAGVGTLTGCAPNAPPPVAPCLVVPTPISRWFPSHIYVGGGANPRHP